MGLFKSLRGKIEVGTDNQGQGQEREEYSVYSSPSGPPPSHRNRNRGAENKDRDDDFTPPTGPPPSYRGQGQVHNNDAEEYVPPTGPPPSHSRRAEDQFVPPSGPPPSHNRRTDDDFLPPPGPPPASGSSNANPPPYHDWTVIPDTALLPPPPPLPQDYSPTNNATYDSAARAHEWCARNPVYTPSNPSHELQVLVNAGHITLEAPPGPLKRHVSTFRRTSPTTWRVGTQKNQQDAIILSSVPLYFACADSPLVTGRSKTTYFQIHIHRIQNANSGIAIGYAARPYPPWRLPGWHRASLGVHGDDGRRFVNDPWGGRDFVAAFRGNETIGIGMEFKAQEVAGRRVKTRVFVTRDGRADDRWGWEIDEERDERDEGVDGLMGEGDLYAAIGVFGEVEFEVTFGDSVR
ncbi:hypothetical protein A1O7_02038 [Cladophialophora yegresii CBS 114405]|uniref:SPRY domain-containing protein n=1 Tax=Cladophialophora yegresii CBS 114405 TaxID=1182544 RepID=W9W9D9_9EURO|nr:uncharacterized protein A1O7_02038 [Cladophialophora yegresii CBS 114405]EXJ61610.1 hypothetical protein A1O7_02038 [Cladophialophora yegresii CBS 114405]